MFIAVNISEEEYSVHFKQQKHPSPNARKWFGIIEKLNSKPEITL
jgi:hypothetical protein